MASTPNLRPTRRTLLAGAALVAPATLLPAIAAVAGQEPDPHPAWHREWRELLVWSNTADTGGRELAEFPQWHRLLELEDLIVPCRGLKPSPSGEGKGR